MKQPAHSVLLLQSRDYEDIEGYSKLVVKSTGGGQFERHRHSRTSGNTRPRYGERDERRQSTGCSSIERSWIPLRRRGRGMLTVSQVQLASLSHTSRGRTAPTLPLHALTPGRHRISWYAT